MRFIARASDDGWGVWDSAVAGFRTPTCLTQDQATDQAAELDVQFDTYGQRSDSDVRWLEQPRDVEVAQWRPAGRIEVWVRERGQWYGRVRDADGHVQWHRAGDLRPATSPGTAARPTSTKAAR